MKRMLLLVLILFVSNTTFGFQNPLQDQLATGSASDNRKAAVNKPGPISTSRRNADGSRVGGLLPAKTEENQAVSRKQQKRKLALARTGQLASSCQTATAAVEGLNTAPQAPYWYKITLPLTSDGYLHVSSQGTSWVDTDLEIYDGCTGNRIAKSDDIGYREQAAVTLKGLTPGATYYIHWAATWSNAEFDWTLSTVTPLPATRCEAAKMAIFGTNTSKAEEGWYTVTLSRPGKLVITAQDQTQVRQIELYSDCVGGYVMESGTNKIVKFGLLPHTPYYIKWTGATKAFSWTMELKEYGAGELCTSAVVAKTGTNTTPQGVYWYTYTMPQDGRLVVNTLGIDAPTTEIMAKSNCQEYLDFGYNKLILSDLKKDEVVLLKVVNQKSELESVTLDIQPQTQLTGGGCTNAQAISEGTFSLTEPFKWYSFTMPSAGKVVLSKLNDYSRSIIAVYSDCQAYTTDYSYSDSYKLLNLIPGKTYMIRVDNDGSPQSLEWSLDLLPYETGEVCSMPTLPVIGQNTTQFDNQWYKVTLPANGTGYLLASSTGTTTVETFLSLYEACGGERLRHVLRSEGTQQAKLELFGLQAGGTYYLHWESPYWQHDTFTWELSFTAPEAGRACGTALVANEGINKAPSGSSWFTFQVPYQARVAIKAANADASRSLLLYPTCDYYTAIGKDSFLLANEPERLGYLAPGKEYLLLWKDAGTAFDWSIEYLPVEDGDACKQAKEAYLGRNEALHNNHWIKFKMPSDGALKISFPHQGYGYPHYSINAYSSCSGNKFMHVGGVEENSYKLEHATKGSIVYVNMSRIWAQNGKQGATWQTFYYDLEVVSTEENSRCEQARQISEGLINQDIQRIGFYTFTMPYHGTATISSSLFYSAEFEVFESCESRNNFQQEYSTGRIINLEAGKTYFLVASLRSNQPEPFTFTLTYSPASAGEACTTPVQVHQGENILGSMPYFASYTMPADGHLLVEKLEVERYIGYTVALIESCSGVSHGAQRIQKDEPVLFYDLKAGQTVLIKWDNRANIGFIEPVAWNLRFVPATAGKEYHWLGASGNWHTLSNWRLTDGSTPVALPGPNDQVVFKANSLPDAEATVQATALILVGSISWEPSDRAKTLISTRKVFVKENISLQEKVLLKAPQVEVQEGSVRFNAGEIQAQVYVKKQLTIQGPAKMDALTVLSAAKVDARKQILSLRGYLSVLPTAVAWLDSASITSPLVDLYSKSTTYARDLALTTQQLYTDADAHLTGTLKELEVTAVPSATAYKWRYPKIAVPNGTSTIKKLTLHIPTALTTNLLVDSLIVSKGSALRIEDGVTLEINAGALLEGTLEQPITLEGYTLGRSGLISKATGEVLGDHLRLRDNTATGGAYFYAQQSQRLNENVYGWNGFKASQQISFNLSAPVFLSKNTVELQATASSGLPVQFEIVSGAATIDGTILTILEEGAIVVRANQPGNEVYDAARSVVSTLETVTGTDDKLLVKRFDVYPVPLQQRLEIRFTLSSTVKTTRLDLLSAEGRLLHSQQLQVGKGGEVALTLPVDHLKRGLYLIRITDGTRSSTRKVVK